MAYVVRMPKLGMEMQEGVLLEWHVAVGDSVAEDDVIAEIESEKTVEEVTAREAGVLRRQLLEEGTTVPPGTPMGVLADEDESIDELLAELQPDEDVTAGGADGATTAQTSTESGDAPAGSEQPGGSAGGTPDTGSPQKVSPRARHRATVLGVDLAGVEGTGMEGSVIEADVERVAAERAAADATPEARRRARDHGIPLASVEGTGPSGAVTAADVEAAAGGERPAARDGTRDGSHAFAEQGARGPHTRTVAAEQSLSGMRRTIADRLQSSWQEAPHVTVSRDLVVDELLVAVDAASEALDAPVSLTDLLLVAVSETLSAHPAFNGTLEDGVHRQYEEHNIGLAVDVDSGLITPVLGRVDERSLPALAARRQELIERVQDGEFTMDDMQGGTFTVSNLGMFGVDGFTPIINPPEVAILGVSRTREVPVAATDQNGVRTEHRLRVDLSFDHRAVDGADAARFLETLAERVSSPWGFLLRRV